MADSEIKRHPDPRLLDFRDKPKWEYSNGLVCLAMMRVWQTTNLKRFANYARSYADSMIINDGTIKTYAKSDYNIDRVNPGKFVMELYKETPKPAYKNAIELLRMQMREHPRTSEGGFWHKKIYPSQMWLDGLYMGSPFLAQYAKEFNEPALYDDVANQFYLIDKYTYDEEKQLFYHGWDESRKQKWSDPKSGVSPEFWGRAMGWFGMALVDALDYIPEGHEGRDRILNILNKYVRGLERYQDPQTGVWWQVMDKANQEGNYLEASCSSMFAYTLLKAVAKGFIPSSYESLATSAYEGVLEQFVKENEDGSIRLVQNCAVAGLGGNPYRDGSYEYYVNEPRRDNDPKGIGPFIMASLEYEKFKQAQP